MNSDDDTMPREEESDWRSWISAYQAIWQERDKVLAHLVLVGIPLLILLFIFRGCFGSGSQ